MNNTKEQVATLPGQDTENGRNYGDQKELVRRATLVAYCDGRFHEIVDARWYRSRSAQAHTHYCSVWIRSRRQQRYFAGHGKAGGYGYCKASAAFQAAMDSAGIRLAQTVYGRGNGPVETAMFAIATACGYGDDVPKAVIG